VGRRGTLHAMRLGFGLGLAVVLGVGLLSCTSESEPPIYFDANYQVRCLDCQPRTADEPERDIALLDGEFDWRISCAVSRIAGEDSLTLTATHETERTSQRYGVRITRAILGDDQSSECRVRIIEGANTYEGACTSGEPTEELPCQVEFEREGGIIEGRVYCNRIRNEANLASYRYLVDPGSSDRAARIEVHNCSGL
jgi:hypothetical protein